MGTSRMINDKYKNISEEAAPSTLSPEEIAEEMAAALEYAKEFAQVDNNRIRGYNPNSPIVDFIPVGYEVPVSGSYTESIYLNEGKMWKTKNEEIS